jgi:hypothetical protein
MVLHQMRLQAPLHERIVRTRWMSQAIFRITSATSDKRTVHRNAFFE